MQAGEIRMLDMALEVGRRSKSRREEREVTKAEFLADVVNDQLMSGKVEGKEFGEWMNKSHTML